MQQIYIDTFSTGTSFSLSPNPHYETFRSSLETTPLQPLALCWPFPLSQELCWIHSSQQASLQPLPLRMTSHWWIWLCPWSLSNLVRLRADCFKISSLPKNENCLSLFFFLSLMSFQNLYVKSEHFKEFGWLFFSMQLQSVSWRSLKSLQIT